ncbi:hypothetical protein NQ315_012797 [Exocentrus adspersus]|uniref:Tc1-like transposase DDE domain-containing protein n=1 Tax=Exocentrus adspersus TaxID=1586481 RepID=A0AAV8VBI6_9CUCU|nr:hypothetical protein NQ315_012797 [Exocentrus adspersus]
MERLSDFIPTKRVKRCALSQNEKIIILNVYNALKYQYPTNTITDTVTNCSKMTGIGISTIYRLIKDTQNGQGTISSPKSSTGRSKVVIEDDLKNVIRRKVHSFYFKKEIPTLNKILSELSEDNDLPKLSRNKLWSVLRELNFCWEKQNRKSILIDKDEIICWRRSYLRSIRKFREEGRNIYYLDETWVNEGYTVTKVWQDKNVKSSRQAFLDGLSTGFKAPSDEMAASRQITVLRLPPYHCELNPIELVWAQVKGDVARNNTSFKLSDVKILLENSLERLNRQRQIMEIQQHQVPEAAYYGRKKSHKRLYRLKLQKV